MSANLEGRAILTAKCRALAEAGKKLSKEEEKERENSKVGKSQTQAIT
jgi:hypothetical protein